jgi:hypothetical protein
MLGTAVTLSQRAAHQAQRRGISSNTVELVFAHADRSRKLRGGARAVWVLRRKRAALTQHGFAPSAVERIGGVRLIVSTEGDLIITIEHMLTRQRCF